MSDVPYSNREIDEKFGEVKSLLLEIRDQTKKTNGRVSRLENWRWMIAGGMAVICFIVVPLVVYINTLQIQSVQAKISEVIK